MSEDQLKDFEARLRKVEDFILSKLSILLELTQDLKTRVGTLEDREDDVLNAINTTWKTKDKEISSAKEEAMAHADDNHRQTHKILAVMFGMFLSVVVYFNIEMQQRATTSQKNSTNIESIYRSLDKIDSKLDKIINK